MRFREGQRVMRYLSSERLPMPLVVTKIHEGLVHCGPWTFDDETGVEEDPEIGWGRSLGITGSVIEEIDGAEWECVREDLRKRMRGMPTPDTLREVKDERP